jgi:Transcription factor WhiB
MADQHDSQGPRDEADSPTDDTSRLLTPAEAMAVPATGDPAWRHRAVCTSGDYDPELWWPHPSQDAVEARAICAGCPVLGDCRDAYLDNDSPGDRDGIWAGVRGRDLLAAAVRVRRRTDRPPLSAQPAPTRGEPAARQTPAGQAEEGRAAMADASRPSRRDEQTCGRPDGKGLCLTAGEVDELCRLLSRAANALAEGDQVGQYASLLAGVGERLREQHWEQSRCARRGGNSSNRTCAGDPAATNVRLVLEELIGHAAQIAVAAGDSEQTVIVVYGLAHLAKLAEQAITEQIAVAVTAGVGWDELGAPFGLTGDQAQHRWGADLTRGQGGHDDQA